MSVVDFKLHSESIDVLYHLDVARSYFNICPSNILLDILHSPNKFDNDACELFIIAVEIVVIPLKMPPGEVKTVHDVPLTLYSIKFE